MVKVFHKVDSWLINLLSVFESIQKTINKKQVPYILGLCLLAIINSFQMSFVTDNKVTEILRTQSAMEPSTDEGREDSQGT